MQGRREFASVVPPEGYKTPSEIQTSLGSSGEFRRVQDSPLSVASLEVIRLSLENLVESGSQLLRIDIASIQELDVNTLTVVGF